MACWFLSYLIALQVLGLVFAYYELSAPIGRDGQVPPLTYKRPTGLPEEEYKAYMLTKCALLINRYTLWFGQRNTESCPYLVEKLMLEAKARKMPSALALHNCKVYQRSVDHGRLAQQENLSDYACTDQLYRSFLHLEAHGIRDEDVVGVYGECVKLVQRPEADCDAEEYRVAIENYETVTVVGRCQNLKRKLLARFQLKAVRDWKCKTIVRELKEEASAKGFESLKALYNCKTFKHQLSALVYFHAKDFSKLECTEDMYHNVWTQQNPPIKYQNYKFGITKNIH